MSEITMVLTMSQEAAEHALEEVEWHTDEGCAYGPFPASDKWVEFQVTLKEAYDKAMEKTE